MEDRLSNTTGKGNNGNGTSGKNPTERVGPQQRPPFSTSQLSKLTSMSMSFVRMEIKLGEIKAVRVGRGRRHVYRIPFGEAIRYMRRIGLPLSSAEDC